MPKPALFVVKATIAPEREAAFNEWYNTRRAAEAARVPGLVAMDESKYPGLGRRELRRLTSAFVALRPRKNEVFMAVRGPGVWNVIFALSIVYMLCERQQSPHRRRPALRCDLYRRDWRQWALRAAGQ